MQRSNKILIFLLITIYSIFLTTVVYGQYPGMAAFRAQQNRESINQQMRMSMNTNWWLNAGDGTTYEVFLKDTTIKEVVSQLYTDSVSHKNFLVFVDKKFKKSDSAHRYQKIYPDQTIGVTFLRVDQGHTDKITSMPQDSCWMFKLISGPIALYSNEPNISNDDIFALSKRVDIQLNYAKLERFDVDTLKAAISKDAKAMKYFQQKKYIKAIEKYNKDVEN